LPEDDVLKNSPSERNLNNCSPFRYLPIEIAGGARIICTAFAA